MTGGVVEALFCFTQRKIVLFVRYLISSFTFECNFFVYILIEKKKSTYQLNQLNSQNKQKNCIYKPQPQLGHHTSSNIKWTIPSN